MWASLPVDFLIKTVGAGELKANIVERIPHPAQSVLSSELLLRVLRLNCLTADFAPVWEELLDPDWTAAVWVLAAAPEGPAYTPAPLGDVQPGWTMATPLRKDFDRRQALVEIDALAAVMLGIAAGELRAIYRTQFGVLRKYERANRYDANGRKVPPDVLKAYRSWQDGGERGRRPDLGRYEPPFVALDREADMARAHAEFTRRLAARGGQQAASRSETWIAGL